MPTAPAELALVSASDLELIGVRLTGFREPVEAKRFADLIAVEAHVPLPQSVAKELRYQLDQAVCRRENYLRDAKGYYTRLLATLRAVHDEAGAIAYYEAQLRAGGLDV